MNNTYSNVSQITCPCCNGVGTIGLAYTRTKCNNCNGSGWVYSLSKNIPSVPSCIDTTSVAYKLDVLAINEKDDGYNEKADLIREGRDAIWQLKREVEELKNTIKDKDEQLTDEYKTDGPVFKLGYYEGLADACAKLREILDPTDSKHLNFDGLIVEVAVAKNDLNIMADDYAKMCNWYCAAIQKKWIDKSATNKSLDSILAERKRQDSKWGEQNHDHNTWIVYIA